MEPSAAPILRLGDPRLRQLSSPVLDVADPTFVENQRRLHTTLRAFRQAYGFGRAIVDEHDNPHEWHRLDRATSELLQHEIDHLDGILAIDRALDRDALILREVFEAQQEYFVRQVDYDPRKTV